MVFRPLTGCLVELPADAALRPKCLCRFFMMPGMRPQAPCIHTLKVRYRGVDMG